MQLADLMEKSEAGSFSVLNFLFQKSLTHLHEVMEETGFSRATLLKYISILNDHAERADLSFSISVMEEGLVLQMDPSLKMREIRRVFLETSIKYRILIYLLYHQHFLAHQLAGELLISEATLNRHLSGLNQLLSEFQLAIQNGTLRGPEHQIRYFYFVLLRKIWSSQDWQAEWHKRERQQEITVLESICGAPLSQGQVLDVVLWSHITQQRLRVQGCQFQLIEERMAFYFETIFYQRLLCQSSQLFAGQHLVVGEKDSELMIFFAFLLSQGILPLHTMEYILGFGGPVAEWTTQLIQKLKKVQVLQDYLDGQVTYELSKLCAQAYIFQGFLLQDAYKYQLQLRPPYLFAERNQLAVAQQIYQELIGFQQGTSLDDKLLWELLQILDYIAQHEKRQWVIGLELSGGALVYHRMATTLQRYLEYNQFITIEPYDRHQSYHLVVTNNPISNVKASPLYYLKNDLDWADLAAIRQLIYR